jgi:hypothetical protein
LDLSVRAGSSPALGIFIFNRLEQASSLLHTVADASMVQPWYNEGIMATIQPCKSSKGVTAYRVLIRRKGQPTQTATFPSLRDAKRWATATEGAIASGRHFKPPSRHTVADMIDRYIAEVLPRKRPSTIPGQARQLRWWRRALGHAMLADVTPAMVGDCRARLTCGDSTLNRYMSPLSHAFNTALKEWGWCDDNPCRKLRRMREPRGRVRYLSGTEALASWPHVARAAADICMTSWCWRSRQVRARARY